MLSRSVPIIRRRQGANLRRCNYEKDIEKLTAKALMMLTWSHAFAAGPRGLPVAPRVANFVNRTVPAVDNQLGDFDWPER